MRKEIKAVICAVLAVWCFFMGFELGSYKEKKGSSGISVNIGIQDKSDTTTQAPQTTLPPETTVAPVAETTTAPASEQTTAAADEETTAKQEQTTEGQQAADPSAMSKKEVLDAVTKAMTAVKSEQNMTAKKTEKVTINLTDLSIAKAKDMINNIIQGLAGEEVATYTFQNGQGTGVDAEGKATDDGATVTPNQVIPPTNKDFTLPEEGAVSAVAKKDGNNTVYTIKLAEEQTTMASPLPQYHAGAYGYLDLTSLDISGVTFTEANMHYPGADIEVTVNGDGKIVKLHFFMPMDGNGAAKVAFFSGNATFEGSDDETWEFTY